MVTFVIIAIKEPAMPKPTPNPLSDTATRSAQTLAHELACVRLEIERVKLAKLSADLSSEQDTATGYSAMASPSEADHQMLLGRIRKLYDQVRLGGARDHDPKTANAKPVKPAQSLALNKAPKPAKKTKSKLKPNLLP